MKKLLLFAMLFFGTLSYASKNAEIVYSNSFLNQSQTSASYTFTPKDSGVYRVTCYILIDSGQANQLGGGVTSTTFKNNFSNAPLLFQSNGDGSALSATAILSDTVNNAISINIQESSAVTYDLYITIERIDQ